MSPAALPLAVAPPASSPEDERVIGFFRVLLLVAPRDADPEDLRARRAELRRNRDPLSPDRLDRRRRERRVEVAVRRGADRWAAERAARAEAARRCEEGRLRREARAEHRAAVEALEERHRALVDWLADDAPRPLRQVVRALAWAHRGREAWERRTRPTYADLLETRAAVVGVLLAADVGFCRFPIVKATS
ncbi:MAG: hypothetical protein M9894_39620 [Planctomycetes bacterium]|nr:hypothetical protein [Planctomycetota bacterium]